MSAAAAAGRTWRVLATALCFAVFGCGALLLSGLWFPLLRVSLRQRVRRVAAFRRSLACSFRCFLLLCRTVGVFDYSFEGCEALRGERGLIVAANHPTLTDYVLLASLLPDADCLVKSELEHNPFLRWVVSAADYLVNDRHELLLQQAGERLARGERLLIFPEGTRSVPGRPLRLQRGCANLALRCGCDIRVVTITCSQSYLTKHTPWYRIPPQRPHFTVRAGPRLSVAGFASRHPGLGPAALSRRLTAALAEELAPAAGGG